MQIEDLFLKNHIDFQYVDISNIPLFKLLSEKIKNYLKCMNKAIKLHGTKYGSAWTTLYSIEDIMDRQETI